MNRYVLALDLGASSGRAMLAAYDGEKIRLREVHRFSNDPVAIQFKANQKRRQTAQMGGLSQSVKEPRQRRGSSAIKEFSKRYSDGGCGCISPPRPSAPKSRKSHGL